MNYRLLTIDTRASAEDIVSNRTNAPSYTELKFAKAEAWQRAKEDADVMGGVVSVYFNGDEYTAEQFRTMEQPEGDAAPDCIALQTYEGDVVSYAVLY